MTDIYTDDIKFWIDTYQQEYIMDDNSSQFAPHADTYNIQASIKHVALNHVRIFGNNADRDKLMYLYNKANKTNKNGDWLRLFAHYSDMQEKEIAGTNEEETNPDLFTILGFSEKMPYVWAIPRDEYKEGCEMEWGWLLGNQICGVSPPHEVIIRPIIFIPYKRKIYFDNQVIWGIINNKNTIEEIEKLLADAFGYTVNIKLKGDVKVIENKWIGNIQTMEIIECTDNKQ